MNTNDNLQDLGIPKPNAEAEKAYDVYERTADIYRRSTAAMGKGAVTHCVTMSSTETVKLTHGNT